MPTSSREQNANAIPPAPGELQPATARPVYRHAELKRLIHPASVAIVGASPKPASFGARTLDNLKAYTGEIHLVNANYPAIGERPCVPSLSAMDAPADCAIVAVPRAGPGACSTG